MGRNQGIGDSFTTAPKPEKPKQKSWVRTVYFGRTLYDKIGDLSENWELSPSAVVSFLVQQGLETGKEPPKDRRRVER